MSGPKKTLRRIFDPTQGDIVPLDGVCGAHGLDVVALLHHLRPDSTDGPLWQRTYHLHLVEVSGEYVMAGS